MVQIVRTKIVERRKLLALTQEQLGARLGVSGQAVSKWETGESLPDILLLPKLCALLGYTVDELLGSTCLRADRPTAEDIAYVLRPLSKEPCLSVLFALSAEQAVTRAELSAQTGLPEEHITDILLGFLKRNIAVCAADAQGKRGYLPGPAMSGVQIILSGCQSVLSAEASCSPSE